METGRKCSQFGVIFFGKSNQAEVLNVHIKRLVDVNHQKIDQFQASYGIICDFTSVLIGLEKRLGC